MIYQVVNHLRKKVCVAQVCRVLEVSRSGYYGAGSRLKNEKACATTGHLKAAFAASGRSYGSRRLVTALHNRGIKIGRYKVRRIMREALLKPVWKKTFVNTTDSKHNLPVAENRLNRQFNPTKPNHAWTSDITYIRTRAGWLYLAVVMDLFSRKIIGWAMDSAMPSELVCRALTMAVGQRKPTAGVIMHSDRGSQYASYEYQNLLKQHGMICSMSRKGNCWDNAVIERFFLNLKMERVWQRDYANHTEAINDITEYIVGFYNCLRLHSALGNLPPMIYEKDIAAKKLSEVSEIS
jgi:transposase InsO family protein